MNEIFWRKVLNELHYLRDRKENQPFVDIINGKNRSTRPNYRILPFTLLIQSIPQSRAAWGKKLLRLNET